MQKIENLVQFKRLCFEKNISYEVVKHSFHPEYAGQKRIVTYADSDCFYSGTLGEPEHFVSKCNGGKGILMRFGKSKDWKFYDNGIISISYLGNHVMDIRLLD